MTFIAPIHKPTPPKPPAPPSRPVGPTTARIAAPPAGAAALPSDATLSKEIEALAKANVEAAAEIRDAYAELGNASTFRPLLERALRAIPVSFDKRLLMHVARLGAEAFVLDIVFVVLDSVPLGYVDDLESLPTGHARQDTRFLQFVMRRLIELSSASLTPEMQEQQMARAIELFLFMRTKVENDSLTASSEAELVELQVLLFEVIEKHYQLLLDGLFANARGSRYEGAVNELDRLLKITRAVNRRFKVPPVPPVYRIDNMTFRDFFDPDKKSDLPFKFFSTKSTPPSKWPTLTISEIIDQRNKQAFRLRQLIPERKGMIVPAPRLHDNVSWQKWVVGTWLREQKIDTFERLTAICARIQQYMTAFTVHVPWDLEEGPKVKSYLARPIPRALTGCAVHDCNVYAVRWMFILGPLFWKKSKLRLRNPQVHLVEMPSHVSVMMRAELPFFRMSDGSLPSVPQHVLLIITNNKCTVTHIDHDTLPEDAAQPVVEDMHSGYKTPARIFQITADLTNADALWKQFARRSGKDLNLPFKDTSEPFMDFLAIQAAQAEILKQVNRALAELYAPMQERIGAAPAATKAAVSARELAAYKAQLPTIFEDAATLFDANVKPLAPIIDDTVKRGEDAGKVRDHIYKDGLLFDWRVAGTRYIAEVNAAIASLDFERIDPDVVFPASDFGIPNPANR